jgi:hypothetical protein
MKRLVSEADIERCLKGREIYMTYQLAKDIREYQATLKAYHDILWTMYQTAKMANVKWTDSVLDLGKQEAYDNARLILLRMFDLGEFDGTVGASPTPEDSEAKTDL